MFENLEQTELFNIGQKIFFLGPVLYTTGLALIALVLFQLLRKLYFPGFYRRNDVEPREGKKFSRIILSLLILLVILGAVYVLGLNYEYATEGRIRVNVALFIEGLLIIQFARFLDWLISNILIHKYYVQRDRLIKRDKSEELPSESKATRIVQYIVYVLAIILILQNFGLDFTLYNFNVKDGETTTQIPFKITNILSAIFIILFARLIVWLVTQLVMYGYYRSKKVDVGAQFAFNQLFSYVIYTIAAIIALQSLGINMTLILGGAAALLVGIGLGLQQTFNDFFSGIVLLFERSIKVGDILTVGDRVGKVSRIGLRSSTINTLGNISLVVPNSKIVNENIINWTHIEETVRFDVSVGVAYGSDTELVKKILIDVVTRNPYVIERPAPFVRFRDFGNSSLDFTIYFFSHNYIFIEDVKSDIRFEIDKEFRAQGVTIPFPQRDVWFKNQPPG